MTDQLLQPSDPLFQEVKRLIDSAKQHAAIAINTEITHLILANRTSHPNRNPARTTRRVRQTNRHIQKLN